MSDSTKPTSPAPTRTQLATAPTVLISPGSSGAPKPRSVLAPRSRLQRFFSADNLRDMAKTLMIVIPVTLIIWGWAEREQVQPRSVTFTLKPIVPGEQYARIEKSSTVTITLTGPNSGLDAFERRLREQNNELAVNVPQVDASQKEVELRQVNVADLLADQSFIREAGLVVKSGTSVDIVVDQMQERKLEVRPPEGLNLLVTTDPATVALRGPRRDLSQVPADAYAILELPTAVLTELRSMVTPGQKKPISGVRVQPSFVPESRSVSLVQTEVTTATFSVPLALEDRAVINYFVVVRVDMPLDLLQKRIRDGKPIPVVNGTLQGIAVRGPRDLVGKVESEDFKRQVFARMSLSRDDLLDLDAGKTIERAPEILLPPGVRVDGAIPTLKVSAPLGGTSDANQ